MECPALLRSSPCPHLTVRRQSSSWHLDDAPGLGGNSAKSSSTSR
jgi:hypothetical protein